MNIIYHESPCYLGLKGSHANGAYFYAKEIYENIIPNIFTTRPWVLLNVEGYCFDNAIVFIHNNRNINRYKWLKDYKNLILICSQLKPMMGLKRMFPQFTIVYLPLSIDMNYVKQFRVEKKTKDTCYYGRIEKCPPWLLEDESVYKLYGENREENLRELAKYKTVYAIGRCDLEAKCLNCEVKSHSIFYDNEHFKLLDNKDVIPILQSYLDITNDMI